LTPQRARSAASFMVNQGLSGRAFDVVQPGVVSATIIVLLWARDLSASSRQHERVNVRDPLQPF
jgi:hypothetical protein